jgi:ParB-like chromosome segregation protein Spo0J
MPNIPLNHLEEDPRNANVCDPELLTKIKNNIQRTGLCPTLIVRPHPKKKNRFLILDGHHRKVVLQQLGWKGAPCEVWAISEKEAQIALLTLNRLRGEDVPRKRAELLSSLQEYLSSEELSQLIPESASEIEDLLSLLQVDTEALEKTWAEQLQLEKETLPVTFGFLVPAQEAPFVEQALEKHRAGRDKAEALVAICKKVLASAAEPKG